MENREVNHDFDRPDIMGKVDLTGNNLGVELGICNIAMEVGDLGSCGGSTKKLSIGIEEVNKITNNMILGMPTLNVEVTEQVGIGQVAVTSTDRPLVDVNYGEVNSPIRMQRNNLVEVGLDIWVSDLIS